uniref:Set domain protein n=1 Tax=Micromonas pusilla TaxID=38833 RepID=A0A7S0KRQ1_MICPS|mmetsp:Transcript_4732/g.17656  ORF Transcript_4732/g.17656 Transcript_4732/m.17656 type:complete len:630 (+) Transcript_4732:25-1914(+)
MTAVATTAHLPPMRTRTGTGRPMPIKPYRHFLVQKNMDRRLSGKNNIQPNPRGGDLLSRAPPAMTKISPKRASAVVPRAAQHSYAEWCKERGVDAPNVSIHYLTSSLPDGAETERGCLVTAPIDAGQVIARCPASIVFALPPSPPNPFPDFCPDDLWDEPPGVAPGRPAQELRMALALIRERRAGTASPWHAYVSQIPDEYDLLGMWTDAQLEELHAPKLANDAVRQRAENAAAASAVCKHLPQLTPAEVHWGLNTVRSRSFLGKYPRSVKEMMPPYESGVDATETLAACDAREEKMAKKEEDARIAAEAGHGANECGLEPDDPAGTAVASCTPGDVSRRSVAQPSVFVVPFLDAFNHSPSEGASGGAGSSSGGEGASSGEGSGATKLTFTDGAFQLVATRAMEPGTEATIVYGAHANDELLLRFGFCVEGSADEKIALPGCMDELEWLMPGSLREADMKAEGLHAAVKDAHLTHDGEASSDLLWALRVLLASDDEYEALGGVHGLRREFSGIEEVGSGAQLAAEASLALACERELTEMGGLAAYEEDLVNLHAVEGVYGEVVAECSLDGGDPERCGGDGEDGNDATFLRRLLAALSFRVNRKRILARAMERYTPGGVGFVDPEAALEV